MKFTIDRMVLTKALASVARIVEKRNTIPILANCALRAKDGALKLQSTDLDLEVTMSIPATIEASGETTVPANLLDEIVRKLAGDTVAFHMVDKDFAVTVSAGRSKFRLQCLPIDDFPDLNVGTFKNTFDIESSVLKNLISKTRFAISTEETRYYLNGIYLHTAESAGVQKLRAVATDGHRLALADAEEPEGAAGMPGIIIPRKTVGELERLMDAGKSVRFEVSESKIRVQVGDITLTSKLIDGTFPDYQRVIPSYSNYAFATFDKKMLGGAADRVATVSTERGRAVKLIFSYGNLALSVTNPDSGTAEDSIPIEYTGDDMTVGFNTKYLQDILANISSIDGRITVSSPSDPAVVRDAAGDDVIYVLMPMRT